MQNPEAQTIQDSTPDATNTPNETRKDSTDESPQFHSSDTTNAPSSHREDAKAAPPPAQMHVAPPPPPQTAAPSHQSQMMPPPQPPFFQPMPMLPNPHFQLPPYLNYHPFFPPYGYPMIFPAPCPNNVTYMEKRPWSTGIFDCFSDLKNSFITACCPCVTFGQVSEILNEGQTPWWEGAMTYFFVEIATVTTGTFLFAWTYRSKMRKKHLLKGSFLWDLIVSCFCTRLSLCQIYRQLDRLGYDVPLGWIANKEKHSQRAMENCRFPVVPPMVESGMFR